MLTEEQINGEIKKLEQTKLQLITQYNQIEGALTAFKLVLKSDSEFEALVEEASVE